MAAEIETAVANRDRAATTKYGRFLAAFWQQLHGADGYLPPAMTVAETGGCAK
jgi:hypothetical protein